jgi:hypothetical protein
MLIYLFLAYICAVTCLGVRNAQIAHVSCSVPLTTGFGDSSAIMNYVLMFLCDGVLFDSVVMSMFLFELSIQNVLTLFRSGEGVLLD